MVSSNKKWVISIIALAFLLRLAFVFAVPEWWAPDEYPHYYYVEKILVDRQFPVSTSEFPLYESYQPPLYYMISAFILKIAGAGPLEFDSKSFVTPVRSHSINIIILRLFSVLSGMGTLYFAYLFAQKIFKDKKKLFIGTFAFIAFLPSFVSNSVSITNDSLANLIGAILVVMLLNKRTFKGDIIFGVLLGLGILTKPNLLVFYPIIIIFLILKFSGTREFLFSLAIIFGISLIIGFPYFLRNYREYGSIIAINPGVPVTSSFFEDGMLNIYRIIRNSFWSFWAAFGRTYEFKLNKFIYLFYFFPLTVLSFAGVIKNIRKKHEDSDTTGTIFWILAVLIFIGSSFFYSLLYEVNCSWGKYFFPVLLAVGILFIKGLYTFFQNYFTIILVIFIISLVIIDFKFLIDFCLC